jgi:hypothetical protein
MKLQDSPKIEDYQEGVPKRKSDNPRSKTIVRLIIGFLTIVIITMTFIAIQNSESFNLFVGVGSISGQVVDHNGQQFSAEVVLAGTDISTVANSQGIFRLDNVPEGTYNIIFLNDSYGWEESVSTTKGQTTDMGIISIPYFEDEP